MFAWNLKPGDEVHGLRVAKAIGRGAYGHVFLAHDLVIGREVALKVVRAPAGSRERKRAEREARIVGRLKSPHVVTIHRVIDDPEHEVWLLVLEYVPGGSLADLLDREERVSVPRALDLLRGIMQGLDAAQQAGVVHGDVKPGNVLLESDGSIKLADFGLSWMVDDASISNTTDEGLGGTPAYMAPEVIMGERGRVVSDIWSAGVIFYRLLTGRMPFPTESLHELFFSVQNASPPPFTDSMPGSVQALAMGMLEKQPAQRPQAPADVIRRLDELSGKPMPKSIEILDEPEDRAVAVPVPRLFGRDKEMARLEKRLESLPGGHGSIVLLGGEAGIGKTALVRNLVERARARGVARLEVSATPLEGVLRPLIRGTRDSLKRAEGRMLDAVLTRLAREVRESLLGHASESPQAAPLETLQQLAWGTEQFLREYGEATPLLLVLENLHAVEPEELRILRELVGRLSTARIVTVLTYRTHDVQASASQSGSLASYHDLTTLSGVDVMELKPLPPDAVLAMLNARLPGTFVAPEVAHQVVATAEGNPLFAGEIVHHLEEIGAIQREGSSLRARDATAAIELPARFHDLVARRLAGLEEDQRMLLDAAAVDGRVFDGEAVAAMIDRPMLGVLRDLQRLYRERHLVEPVGDQYRFTSKLIQSVIYDQIAPALRRAMHAGLAAFLESRDEDADPERLGLHWEQAGKADRARPYLLRAARDAGERHLHRRALSLAERAGWVPGALGPDDARDEPQALLELGKTLVALNRNADALSAFDVLARHAADDRMRLWGEVERNYVRFLVDGADGPDESVLRTAAEFDGDAALRGMALTTLGRIAKQRDRLSEAEELLSRAATLFRDGGDRIGLAGAQMERATVLARTGLPEQAEALYEEVAAIHQSIGRDANACVCQVNRALSRIHRGVLEDNVGALERAFRTLQLGGYVAPAAHTGCHLSQLHYALGDIAAAFATLAESREIAPRIGQSSAALELRLSHFILLLAKGRVTAARQEWLAAQEFRAGAGSPAVDVALACADAQWRTLVGDASAVEPARSALDQARAADAERIREYPGWELVELVPFGLDASVFPRDEPNPMLAGLFAAAHAYADPSTPPDELDETVRRFEAEPPSWRRAALRLWRDAIRDEAQVRRGEDTRASREESLAAARSLGHVWWEAHFLRRLAAADPDSAFTADLDRLVFDIADASDDPSQKRRIVEHWSRRRD